MNRPAAARRSRPASPSSGPDIRTWGADTWRWRTGHAELRLIEQEAGGKDNNAKPET
jgi:hypothetical protein